MDKTERFNESVRWSILLHFIYFLLLSLFLIFESFMVTMVIGIIGVVFTAYYLILRKYRKEELFAFSWILLIAVIHIGAVLSHLLRPSIIIGIGAVVSIQDILSFTRFGKKTMNARTMANTNLTAKIILYALSPKDGHLIPTKGFGDFLFYSFWISHCYLYTEGDWRYLVAGIIAIFIGSLIEYFIISKIYLRENYKGFPATPIPFACILPVMIVAISNLPG